MLGYKYMNEIKRRRKILNLTQAELGKRAGLSQACISDLEVHRYAPNMNDAEKLARALDTSVVDILTKINARER